MRRSVVVDMIVDAFHTAPIPDAGEIVPSDDCLHVEQEEIREAFRGHAWNQLSVELLTYHRQAVFFFTPNAWAYYLPAYMLAILHRYEETDTMPNELLSTVTPGRDLDVDSRRRARLAALDTKQLGALVAFVEWMADEHPDDVEDDLRRSTITCIEQHIGAIPKL